MAFQRDGAAASNGSSSSLPPPLCDSGLEAPLESLNTSLGANPIPMSKLNGEMSCIDDTAQGSFGVVKRGRLDIDKRWYAIKQTKRVISGEGDLQQRLQEVYALSSCDHPNVVRYFDAWVEDRAVFVRTEWVPHGSVADTDFPLPEERVLPLLHQISSALHHLHTRGILHRDVKPENILVRRAKDSVDGETEFTFKLCDFGLARPVYGHTSPITGEVFRGVNDDDGDRKYLSPEALTACNALPVGSKADIYALGASCVELMGGDPAAARRGCLTFAPDLYSPSLISLVRSMTAHDPDARPSAFVVATQTLHRRVLERPLLRFRLQRIDELRRRIRDAAEAEGKRSCRGAL